MAGNYFSADASAVSVTSTAKSLLGIKTATNQCVVVSGFQISFDGTDTTKGPGVVEICKCTFATNSPGTNSTSITPVTTNGRSETIQTTAGKTWTTEPTVITVLRTHQIPSYTGFFEVHYSQKDQILVVGASGLVVRVTMPSAVTVNAAITLYCEE